MKKKSIITALSTMAVAVMAATSIAANSCKNANDNELRTLPSPTKNAKMTLMEALQQRHSVRDFSDKDISDAELSELLWAACGINRPETKKITAPSAINAQDILVYVCTKGGAWLYIPESNSLKKVCDKDLRSAVAGRQESVAVAPISLVLVSDHSKFGDHKNGADTMGAIDAGYVSQNICLACTALELATVPRMTMDKETLAKELQLNENKVLLLNHPVGYEKQK